MSVIDRAKGIMKHLNDQCDDAIYKGYARHGYSKEWLDDPTNRDKIVIQTTFPINSLTAYHCEAQGLHLFTVFGNLEQGERPDIANIITRIVHHVGDFESETILTKYLY